MPPTDGKYFNTRNMHPVAKFAAISLEKEEYTVCPLQKIANNEVDRLKNV